MACFRLIGEQDQQYIRAIQLLIEDYPKIIARFDRTRVNNHVHTERENAKKLILEGRGQRGIFPRIADEYCDHSFFASGHRSLPANYSLKTLQILSLFSAALKRNDTITQSVRLSS